MKRGGLVYTVVGLACLFSQIAEAATSSITFSRFEVSKAGLYPQLEKRFGQKHFYTEEEVLSTEASKPVFLKAEEIKTHFGVIAKLDPTKAHLYDELVKWFGKKLPIAPTK
jgi:hypothetical protein